jgi:hypothetical protein
MSDQTSLEVNQAIIADWRAAARSGIDLTEEQLAAAVSFYRKSRAAAPAAKGRAKKLDADAKLKFDDSVFD